MRRMHRKILNQATETDIFVQKLVLAKTDHPAWVLTSSKSKSDVIKGLNVDDFTETPEWCDPQIYFTSL